jgi:hypothetical protein
MAGKIFINYRRDDSIGMAGRLHDRLALTFGRDNLFMDVDHIPVGEDFEAHLNRQVAECNVVLVVIGPNWLNAKDESGGRRLDNPDDFVAIEIAAALARGIRVIPVLVDGARMPKASELPDFLKPLARRQAAEVRHAHFGQDAETLVARMREALGDKAAGPSRWRARAAIGVAAVALVLLIIWGWRVGTQYIQTTVQQAAQQAEIKRGEQAKAAEAEEKRKAEQAEQQQLAALKAEEERQARAATEAEAKRKAEEAEQQRTPAHVKAPTAPAPPTSGGAAPLPQTNTATATSPGPAPVNPEVVFWNSIKNEKNPDLFEAYLKRYPDGAFADLARIALQESKPEKPSLPPPARQTDDSVPIGDALLLNELRDRLYELNFDPGPLDGPLTDANRKVIREFQQQINVLPTGIATMGLLRRLRELNGLKPWASIVFGKDTGKWGMAWDESTRKAAVARARVSCGDSSACPVEVSFFGISCGAFAYSGASWAITARDDIRKAKAAALADCSRHGKSCQIVASVCADGAERFSAK